MQPRRHDSTPYQQKTCRDIIALVAGWPTASGACGISLQLFHSHVATCGKPHPHGKPPDEEDVNGVAIPSSFETLPRDADRVLVLANPKAGARSGAAKVQSLISLLGNRGFEARVVTDPAELLERSQEAMNACRLRAVVAAGGDGTAALAINRTPLGAPIAVLPLGTENLLAKYLGQLRPEDVCQTIERGAVTRLDVGQANGQLFLLMLSCGFDAHVVDRLHADRRGHIRHWSYAKPILHSLRTYGYPEMRLTAWDAAGERIAGELIAGEKHLARWVFAMNLPCYARGLPIAPGANGFDGLLDVCTFRHGRLWNGLRYLSEILLRRHHLHPECLAFRARRLRIEADSPVPFQIDGDPGGLLPVDVEVIPGRWTMLAPIGWSERNASSNP